ncbi:LacI family DNA-binding transcriptional regulator [Mobilicoccus pelagius]|uniref:Putative LacI family transcriptional regulator n=1 Tax=Mobilicoccus pelagius NBRC 104925 TaxID=1089455 RepID=H5URF1_9MICO|nr:LacI family DNA-binding transcriptional regulator [Mobilicoccus pelagius]GAB48309.1 putative LacI family transcriptional regulator [Mobilicoccus pelagius NBRC 104925]
MTGRRGGVGWTSRTTARDVAALAGVSPQTVSRVAADATNVRPETREKVLDAMTKLGYTPNAAARALRSGRSDLIGVVVHHVARTGEARIVDAVVATAHAHGYATTLVDAPDGTVEHLNAALRRLGGVAGVVVLGLETADVDRLHVPARLPVVVADSRSLVHPAVGFDQRGGAQAAVAHLLGLDHETVHMLAGPADSLQSREREEAWRAMLTAAGREVPALRRGDWTPTSGYEVGRRLAADPSVTAVFAANDEMAAGLLRALHEAGRRIPEEVSVVGFDDVLAEHLWPPLTTVHQDFAGVGANLVRELLRRIDVHDVGGGVDPADAGAAPPVASTTAATTTATSTTLVPAHLVVRESTGPAPRRTSSRPAGSGTDVEPGDAQRTS